MTKRLSLALLLAVLTACTEGATPVNPGKGIPSADATRSTVTVQPSELVADGQQVSTVTVTVLDKNGMPIEGTEVSLSASGELNTLTQPPKTDASGVAKGTIASTRAETKRLTLRAGTGTKAVELAQHPEVKFTPGAPTRLSFLAQPASTSAGETLAAVRVTAVDAHGNRVTAPVTVALALEGGAADAVLVGTSSQDATAGVAAFEDLSIERAGIGYTLRATAQGLQEAVSNAFDISAGAVSTVTTTFEVDRNNNVVANGSDVITATLIARDAFGNPLSGQAVGLAVSGTGNTLEPTSGTTGAEGRFVATLKSTKAELKTLTATLGGAEAGTRGVTFVPGPPTMLAFVAQPPASTQASQTLSAVRVAVMDVQGNTTMAAVPVTLALQGGTAGAVLGGTHPRTTSGGVAEFGDLFIRRAGTGYTLRASADSLASADSNAFNITADAPSTTRSTVVVGPNNVVANGTDTTTVTVTVLDAFDNPVAGRAVTVAVSGTGNTLAPTSGGTTGADGKFVVTLKSTKAETKTVDATVDGAALPTHPQVTFVHGPPAKLVFLQQPPASVTAGAKFSPAVQLEVLDAHDNRVVSAGSQVTVGLTLTPSATLGGTPSRDSVAGLVSFNDLDVKRAGINYILSAAAPSLPSVDSNAFTVTAGAPASETSTFTATSPITASTSDADASTLTVTVKDEHGNPVAGKGVTVAATSGVLNVFNPADGRGTTNALGEVIVKLKSTQAEEKNLQATVEGLATAMTASVTVKAAALSSLVLVASPTEAEADGATPINLTVTAQDAFGNLRVGDTVTLSFTSPDFSGPLPTPSPASGTTNASGQVTATLTSTTYGAGLVRASAGTPPNDVVDVENVTFLRPRAAVTALQSLGLPDPTKGCVSLEYTVKQAESARANVLFEYNAGSGWKRATQAGASSGSGVTGVATTPAGITHTFLWNSTADVPALTATTRVRITTQVPGAKDFELVVPNIPVTNGLAYAATQAFAAGTAPQALAMADMDRDGKQDAVVLNPSSSLFTVLTGDGAGGFTAGASPTVGIQSNLLLVVDVNRDGRPDVVTAGGTAQVKTTLNTTGGYSGLAEVTLASKPVGLASGDFTAAASPFNPDGKLDLVVALEDGSVVVLAGNGAGGWTERTSTAGVGASLQQLVAGDFNRDGVLDVAVADADANVGGVKVLIGTKTGTFGAPTRLDTGDGASVLQAEDVDGDGRLDLLVGHGIDNTLVLAQGVGNGSFTLGTSVALGGAPSGLAVRDLDRDGRLDVLVAGVGQGVLALKGLGSGLFAAPEALAAGGATVAVAAADLDRDGRLDVVATRPSDNRLVRKLSTQVARCEPSLVSAQQLPVDPAPSAVVLADFDGDARPDMAVASANAHTVTVARGLGNGAFGPQTKVDLSASGGTKPQGLVAGDFNKDGHLDLVASNTTSGTLSLLLNNGSGGFGAPISVTLGATTAPRGLVAGDFDGDKKLDLAVTSSSGSKLVLLFGNDDGTFPRTRDVTTGSQPYAVVAADLDSDGDVDLATANFNGNSVSVLLNTGAGIFSTTTVPATIAAPRALGVGDFDGDQKLDLIVTSTTEHSVTLLSGKAGNGTFQPQPSVLAGAAPFGLVVTDLDGDKDLDVATASNGASGITLLRNDGLGAFTSASLAVGNTLTALHSADLDGDGLVDLVATLGTTDPASSTVDNRVAIVRSAGTGVASAAQLTTSPASSLLMSGVSADVNRDGIPDLLLGSRGAGALAVWQGSSSGGFDTGVTVKAANNSEAVAVGDLDGNGTLDAILASYTDGSLSVLSGDGNGGFTSSSGLSRTASPSGLMLEYLNADAFPDLVVVSASGTSVTVVPYTVLTSSYGATWTTTSISFIAKGTVFADFNGDGRKDVAVCGRGTNGRVEVLLANASGTLDAPKLSVLAADADPVALAAADINRDGKMDVAVALKQTPTSAPVVLTLFGKGDGTFTVGGGEPRVTLVAQPKHLALADLDGDALVDIVVSADAGLGGAPKPESLFILRGDGTGVFGGGSARYDSWAVGAGTGLQSVSSSIGVADLNRDGLPDLFMAGSSAASVVYGR